MTELANKIVYVARAGDGVSRKGGAMLARRGGPSGLCTAVIDGIGATTLLEAPPSPRPRCSNGEYIEYAR
jgi:hypothetical protein